MRKSLTLLPSRSAGRGHHRVGVRPAAARPQPAAAAPPPPPAGCAAVPASAPRA